MLEQLLNPNKKVSTSPFNTKEFEEYKLYTKQVGEAEKAAEEGGVTSNVEEEGKKEGKKEELTPDEEFIKILKKSTRKEMITILSDNGITEKDGLKYRIYKGNAMLGGKSADKTKLTEHLQTEYNNGRIINY